MMTTLRGPAMNGVIRTQASFSKPKFEDVVAATLGPY